MSVAIEVPGTAVLANAQATGATTLATLAAPAAGVLNVLDGFIITVGTISPIQAGSATLSGLAGGSINVFVVANATAGSIYAYTFPAGGYPAAAAAAAISLSVPSVGATVNVTLFGHTVPL